ncbi:tRNAse Z TRZ4, mitochondrial isoform X1 [Selaginella moellendorffii]|uniref:tRNAse Z TRZ4, mitochondrial isoform X1 n=1 Tax=Selaginella moellendorffii TaxID=88036 RepID=UPI000D1CF6EA|nr:tRNAse Z TRZ4, mitochondrial isoform X1 [Selaginella moellendorffii]|eukprot:XP_024515118.1 tRNAse Z TRZ4, mitochondrial isoform X1 [Selaginella moellendorffii]
MAVEAMRLPRAVSLRPAQRSSKLGTSYIQILGTGMEMPSVLLFFDNKRFIFNAGEGMQRFCVEHKIKLSKIDHILFTRVCSETCGGLPGALLTLARDLEATVNIWGPSKLQFLLNAMSTFIPNSSILHAHIFGSDTMPQGGTIIDDDAVKISGTLLQPCSGKNCEEKEPSVVYVCELPEVKGRFDPAKAVSLGLQPGQKYGLLQRGMTVETDDGARTIHPDDVMEPSTSGPVFVVVDCPTVSHIPALTSAASLEALYSSPRTKAEVVCVVHLSPLPVVEDAGYSCWMTKFAAAQHVLAGPGCCRSKTRCPIFKSSALLLAKLNMVCPRVFPFNLGVDKSDTKFSENSRVVAAHNLLKFQLLPLPLLGLEKSPAVEDFNLEAIQTEFLNEIPELLSIKQDVKLLYDENALTTTAPACISSKADDLEIVFLGTGSMHPSKHRNVSAIYLHLFERGGMLLDCGEGTYGQLKRRYGIQGADSVLANLKCIWISHIHADHQSGLTRILTARKALLQAQGRVQPILVIGPMFLRRYLTAYERLETLAMDFLDCSQTTIAAGSYNSKFRDTLSLLCGGKRKHIDTGETGYDLATGLDETGRKKLDQVLQELGLTSLLSVPVIHCAHSFGIVLESAQSGWKFAFSGDTRPCDAFVEAAKGATIFVHEATFDDGLLAEALEKNHSLTCEAVQAGAAAGAYRTILTHFSQRYPQIPVFDASYNDRTCIAFDMMSVNLVDLPLLPKLVPVMKLMFKEE